MGYVPPAPIPGVADVVRVAGAQAPTGAAPDLLLEVPHGATRAADFDALAARLVGPFPPDLRAFFFVNTDVGAPEVALLVAQSVVERAPRRTALVIRCRVPRTFVDCNRLIDADTKPSASAAGAMTPGLPPYLSDPRDVALLVERCYLPYRRLVTAQMDAVLSAGGRALMVHTYAPRSVDVPVDERIVERLREAYTPEGQRRWPLRAEVDLITHDPDGRLLADADLVERAAAGFAAQGLHVARNAAYALHPSTLAHRFATAYPGRTLCLEIRRDLLVPVFTPFAEMRPDDALVERAARPLAEALTP